MSDERYTVDQAVKAYYLGEVTTAYAVTLSNGSTVTLLSSDDLYRELSMRYGCYYFYPPSFLPLNVSHLRDTFLSWLNRNNDNIARQIETLAMQYDPIANYDMTEQAADGTKIAKETTTATPSGTMSVASAHTGTDTTTDSRYGFDSTTGEHADKSELAHGETVTDTTSFVGYKTETETESAHDRSVTTPDGSTLSGLDSGSEHYLRRYGNIGITTSAQLATGELELRVHDIAIEWLERFADEYLIYVG